MSDATAARREDLDALEAGRHPDAFALLGPHAADGGVAIRALIPGAERAEVIDGSGGSLATMERLSDSVFEARLERRPGDYRFRATRGSDSWEAPDPYRFGPVLGELDEHLIGEGTHRRLWDVLGAHVTTHDGVEGTVFAVWAPSARRVSVVGDFNDWDGRRHVMRWRGTSGVAEIFVPGIGEGTRYKYEIIGADGGRLPPKADPVGFGAEHPPENCSVVRDLRGHDWRDGDWMASRAARHRPDAPISIYEVHLPSWQRGEGGRPLSWEELAERLVPYVVELGFTHLEVMPISEYPFDGSWGYQPIGLYAPTVRHGPPGEFRRFVEACHAAGLGLIVDWVPGHFPADLHGLGRFDGTALYEHADPREGFHQDWNTLIYNYGRREVANFLVANALYWIEEHHVDALRVDAVASMLYRDYSRADGEWVPNVHGGRENLEAIAFLQRMNAEVYGRDPSVMTIAEESTSWPGVSRPVHHGGLGFGFKWNMGWMNDTLRYMGEAHEHRPHHHHLMTFGLHYAFSENFVLPLSHDEVVHGKGSIIGRMPGDAWQKFANLRAYYTFMWTHPGKKLLFMGSEFGQWEEWNHQAALDWDALGSEHHAGVRRLVGDLNRLYRETPSLHALDAAAEGFEWVDGGATGASALSWIRHGPEGTAPALCLFNFSDREHTGWRFGVPVPGRWVERLNSDAAHYGGSGRGNMGGVASRPEPCHGKPHSVTVTLPPLSGIVLVHDPDA